MPNPVDSASESAARIFSGWLLKAYRRPLWFLLILVVVPLAIIMAATYVASAALARAQAQNNLRMTAQLASEAIQETLDDAVLFGQLTAMQPAFTEALDHRQGERLAALLRAALPLLPHVDFAQVATADGQVVASYPPRGDAPATLAQDAVFRAAQTDGWHPEVSAVYLRDETTLEKVVDVVMPVARAGEVVGVLRLEFQVAAVKAWIQRIRVDPEGFLYVVDQQQQLVVYPFQVLPGKPKVVGDWPPVAYDVPPSGHAMSFRDPQRGRDWLAGVYPIGETGWRVIAVQPQSAVFRLIHRVFWPMGILVALLMAAVVFVSLRWAALQALNLRLLQQNAKLLKQSQQRWTLERGKPDKREGGTS